MSATICDLSARCAFSVSVSLFALAGCATMGPGREIVFSKDAPAAIGPYSQAIKAGNLVFLSGQVALDPASGKLVSGGIEEQTRQVLENLKAVLKASDLSVENVVSTTVFIKDINDFAKMNAVYGSYFKDKPPARATVEVARLPRDALVEISAIASK